MELPRGSFPVGRLALLVLLSGCFADTEPGDGDDPGDTTD